MTEKKKKVVKKILLDTREELDIIIPAKATLHPNTSLDTKVPLTLNLSWLPKHIKVLVLGKDGTWSCQGNANTPFRVNRKGGNTECMSVNAKDCLVAHPRSCEKLRANPPRKLKPLSCGKEHMKVWGMTGYQGAGHWCNTFRNVRLDQAQTVLVNTRTHKTLATGAMKGSRFAVKKVYPEFVPLLSKVRQSLSQNLGLTPPRKPPV
jgi:hypothetical protein